VTLQKTAIFGKTWVACGSVLSTMDVAREVFARAGEYGTVVKALSQTAGRGRQGKPWFTPPEGSQISMTAIGYPVAVADAWRLAALVGVAVVEGLVEAVPECQPRLRFPNDILLGNKKLAGVLIETIPLHSATCVPLIGIGINVNVPQSAFPLDLQDQATSLVHELGREIHAPIPGVVIRSLERLWAEPPARWLPRWHALLAPQATRIFMLDGLAQRCRVVLLRPQGELVVETEEGQLRTLSAAQVIFGEE
jgi:BirA family transcriptional regulator, biotin operon repressor / biotin---[acetyl-CoA-carboxylase] ligase